MADSGPVGYDSQTGEIVPLPQPEQQARNLIFASPECGEVFSALCKAQGEMEMPKRTHPATVKGTTKFGKEYEYKYNYAPLEEILRVIKGPAAKAGLSWRQFLAVRGNTWMVRTIVVHGQSGQWYGCDYPLFWDESKGMQGFASGNTYARRQSLTMTWGLAAEDDDDAANSADGNAAAIAPKNNPTFMREHAPAREETADKRWAYAAYKKVQEAIDNAQGFRELLDISGDHNLPSSPDWADMQKAVTAVESEQEAKILIDRLKERIERKKKMLLGEVG